MRWTLTPDLPTAVAADLLVIPVSQVDEAADLSFVLKLAAPPAGAGGRRKGKSGKGSGHPDLKDIITRSGFTAKTESMLPVWCPGVKAGWMLLVGLGEAKELDLQTLRRVAGRVARHAGVMKATQVALAVPPNEVLPFCDHTFSRCWVEGAELALSPTGELKTGKTEAGNPRGWKVSASRPRQKALRSGLTEGQAYAAGCLFSRQLVDLPPNILTPADLATRARRMARAEGLKCTVLGVPQLRKMKMGGLLGVGQGSAHPPRLIVLEYKPKGKAKAPHVALVGKGITFDSGGISLKPGANMDHMKSDMGGAAAVLGAALIAARLKLPMNLTVVVPTAENMPDGNAIKPADILTMASGKTVEVLNTDAEGRLILADGLWYAGRAKPDYIIDAATLTGACVVALGSHFAGLMGNSSELIDVLRQAGGETFERVWHLPLVDEHKKIMEGACSDLQNIGGGREGGALTAAAFLSAFVPEDMAWAHLDIAGPAFTTSASATGPKGGTGFGARLMARALQILVD